MKTYIGTKRLEATPMTLGDYNNKRGWTIPADENPDREGYFVKYSDDYVSWSPKEVFEESYSIEKDIMQIERVNLQAHQERVVEEANELADKCEKLSVFIESNSIFTTLFPEEQVRLKLQLVTMQGYYSILVDRINNF